ncbi:MAG: Lrp/AsnC family transcriptional regulator [Betaproteobacteria bacterium]|nr:Lrp/AsnC family transcriptional regulator [Betaproteobacteria bacterium]
MNDMIQAGIDATDRRIVLATQGGLPLEREPYAAVARAAGVPAGEVMRRLRRMLDCGIIRRIGAVPNHYALGFKANGMSVWDVDDARVDALGPRVGALEFVSHCYQRPRVPPHWPFNLFAMVHERDRGEVGEKLAVIAALLGDACRGHEVLYSTRILKKTGLRLAG